jgi:hypothetical protein
MLLSNFRGMGDEAIMIITSGEELMRTNTQIVKTVMDDRNLCLYVAVNQPYARLKKTLESGKINTDRVFFIDCITETSGGKAERASNCLYINSPSRLTELGISIMQALQAMPGKKFLFLDALSTLIIYNSSKSIAKFSHFLITRVKLLGLAGIFIVVEKEIDEMLLSQIKQFCDKVVRMN